MLFYYNIFLYFTFTAFSLISASFIIYTRNPIFSVFFLVFTFFNVACILLLFDFEFIPISFIVIYVGAVAVLFLFILMMLNIKLSELNEHNTNFLPVSFLLGFAFLLMFFNIMGINIPLVHVAGEKNIYYLFDLLSQAQVNNFLFNDLVDLNSNIVSLSKTLFNGYVYCFVLSGFALLLAMISAIILTLQKKFISRNQNVYKQILKNYDKSLVHYDNRKM